MKPEESKRLSVERRSVFAVERDADGYHLSSNRTGAYVLVNATAAQVAAFVAGCNALADEVERVGLCVPWLPECYSDMVLGCGEGVLP